MPTAVPTAFSLTVPANWFEIDVHPDTRNSAINSLVTERLHNVPALYEHRAALVRALRNVARVAYSSGAVYCAVMAEGIDTGLLTATVTVTIVQGSGIESGAESIGGHLTTLPRRGAGSPWRRIERAGLPHVGMVARTVGVEDIVMPEGAGWVRSVLMQTFIPFPGTTPGQLAVITASSSILALEEQLFELFEAITSTFRFAVIDG